MTSLYRYTHARIHTNTHTHIDATNQCVGAMCCILLIVGGMLDSRDECDIITRKQVYKASDFDYNKQTK